MQEKLKQKILAHCWQDWAFYVSLALWLTWKILNTSMLAVPDGSLINTGLHGLLLLGLIASRLGFIRVDSDLALFLLGLAVGVGVKFSTSSFLIIDLAVLLYAGSRFPFRHIAVIYCVVIGVLVSTITICSLIGIVPNYEFSRGDKIRYGLGFLYSTFVSHYLFYFVLMYLYVRRNSIGYWEYGLIAAVNLLIFWLTDSRNSFLLVCVAMAIAIGLRLLRDGVQIPRLVLRIAGQWPFLILVALSIFSVIAFDASNPAWSKLNGLLSNRLIQQQVAMESYDITLFGNDIEFNGNALSMTDEGAMAAYEVQPGGDYNYVDNSYLLILLTRGVCVLAMILASFTLAGREAAVSGDALLCFILLLVAVHSTVDDLLLEITRDGFLFLAWGASGRTLQKMEMAVKRLCARSPLSGAEERASGSQR